MAQSVERRLGKAEVTGSIPVISLSLIHIYSDADVLVHAIMDALLGAAALRDIGRHFPDNDPAYEGADSIELLKKVGEMLEERMYLIENIDATVIAQKPKLLPYIDTMVKNVAEALHLEEDQVNIKATTEEGLGLSLIHI